MGEIWKAKSPVPAIEAFRRYDPAQMRELKITGPGPEGTIGKAELEPPKDPSADNLLRLFNEERRRGWLCVQDLTELLLQFKAELKKGGSDGGA